MASSLNFKKSGKFVGAGVAKKIVLGFKPRKVELVNITDVISYKKIDLMDAAKGVKTSAAGASTYVDSITLEADGFTVAAAEAVAAKTFVYFAEEGKNE